MSEFRWHPTLREWVITSTERQDRTFLPPKDYCPLCPQREGGAPTEIPTADFHVAAFQNKFPSLRPNPPHPAVEPTSLSPVETAAGECEVIVYTPEHDATLAQLPVDRIEELIYVWQDRYVELGKRPDIEYIYIFENKGEAIGVTLHHPHGQLYAFPFIPPRLDLELEALKEHREATGRCLICDAIAVEREDGRREVVTTEHFYAGAPFYARWPYEVHLWSREHRASLAELNAVEMRDLAVCLKDVLRRYDALFGFSLPYMMIVKQLPTDGRGSECDHFRIEFYPPNRTATKLKYLAGVETGAGTWINDTLAEETAAALRVL